jgi:hypothetical protein
MRKIKSLLRNLLVFPSYRKTYVKKNLFYISTIIFIILFSIKMLYIRTNLLDSFLIVEKYVDVLLYFYAINIIVSFLGHMIISNYRRNKRYPKDHYDNFTIGVSGISYIYTFFFFFY